MRRLLTQTQKRLPRMRGDRPIDPELTKQIGAFTPHARGSTCLPGFSETTLLVYPACAGIDLADPGALVLTAGLPRMRGDRPEKSCGKQRKGGFTPYARGSTTAHTSICRRNMVYPACAGIDL